MAAPWKLKRVFCHPGTHGVQVEVAHQFQEILISIDQYGFVSPLEEVPRFPLSPVGPARVAEGEVLHDSRQGDVRHLNQQMDVVGHETESMDAMAVALCSFLHEEVEAATVLVVEEDVLPGVASQDHVVKGAWIMDSGFSGHGGSLALFPKDASLTPVGSQRVHRGFFFFQRMQDPRGFMTPKGSHAPLSTLPYYWGKGT